MNDSSAINYESTNGEEYERTSCRTTFLGEIDKWPYVYIVYDRCHDMYNAEERYDIHIEMYNKEDVTMEKYDNGDINVDECDEKDITIARYDEEDKYELSLPINFIRVFELYVRCRSALVAVGLRLQ